MRALGLRRAGLGCAECGGTCGGRSRGLAGLGAIGRGRRGLGAIDPNQFQPGEAWALVGAAQRGDVASIFQIVANHNQGGPIGPGQPDQPPEIVGLYAQDPTVTEWARALLVLVGKTGALDPQGPKWPNVGPLSPAAPPAPSSSPSPASAPSSPAASPAVDQVAQVVTQTAPVLQAAVQASGNDAISRALASLASPAVTATAPTQTTALDPAPGFSVHDTAAPASIQTAATDTVTLPLLGEVSRPLAYGAGAALLGLGVAAAFGGGRERRR